MDTIDTKYFEISNKNIQLVRTVGESPWRIEIFYNPDDAFYYAKGPFARWDAICYVKIPFTEKTKIDEWIERMAEFNK